MLFGFGDIDLQSWSSVCGVSYRSSIDTTYKYVCMCVCMTSILVPFMRIHTYTRGPSHTGAGTSVWCVC